MLMPTPTSFLRNGLLLSTCPDVLAVVEILSSPPPALQGFNYPINCPLTYFCLPPVPLWNQPKIKYFQLTLDAMPNYNKGGLPRRCRMPMALFMPVQVEGVGRATTGISRQAAQEPVCAPRAVLAISTHPLMSSPPRSEG